MEGEPSKVDGAWIRLNVGGTRLITTRDTLTMVEPHSVLARMFGHASTLSPALKDEKGFFMIDRSAEPFQAILLYLRTGAINHSVVGLKEEAAFWGLTDLLEKLNDQVTSTSDGYCVLMFLLLQKPDFPDRGSFVRASLSADAARNEAFVGLRFCTLDLSMLVLEGILFQRCNFSRCNLRGFRSMIISIFFTSVSVQGFERLA